MDAGYGVAAGSAALASMALAHALLGLARAVPPDERGTRRALPPYVRWCWPLVRAVAWHGRALLSTAVAARFARALRRAELLGPLRPGDWLGVLGVYAAAGLVLATAAALVAGLAPLVGAALGLLAGAAFPALRLRDAAAVRAASVRRELPTYLDVLTLAVEAGCSLATAITQATEKAPDGPLRRGLQRLLGEIRAGRSRADALRGFDEWMATPAVTALVGALLQAERTGASLGPVLRAQAEQRTQERFLRAEKLAMEAPVKMLAPLILCIFPCTFLVLGFPIALRLMEGF